MSKSFRRVYPDIGTQKILFDGGLNNKFEDTLIADNESPSCLNVIFENGSVGTRGGSTKLNTIPVGAPYAFDAVYTRNDKSGAETMIVWAAGSAYYLATTTFITIPSAQSIFTSGVRVAADQAENQIFFGNGGTIPYKYNGAEFTRHGVYPPTTTMTAASQAAGVLTGDYRYKVTYVNSNAVESDVSPVMATFTAAGATIRVTIPTAPISHGINSRKIYRTDAGGAIYQLVTTVSDNTTTTYDDNIADAALGADAPTDQGVPPLYKIIVWHPGLSRFFMNDTANENYIWYSEANNPYVVKVTNFDRFGNKAADIVHSFYYIENALVVWGNRGGTIWYFPDNDPTNWYKVPIKSFYGCLSPYAIVPYKNGLIYPATENGKFVGFAHLSGDTNQVDATLLTISSMGSELLSQRIEPDIFEVNSDYIQNMSAMAYKNKIYFSLSYGDGQTTNNRIYVFDHSYSRLKKSAEYSWCPWTGINATQFTVYNGNLYSASSVNNGYVFLLNDTSSYYDNGSAIDSYWWTKNFYGFAKDADYHKDFRYVQIYVDNAGDYFMNVTYLVDSDTGAGDTQTIDLDPGANYWGSLYWGTDEWGSGTSQTNYKLDLGTKSGERIMFKFSNQNTGGQRFKVHFMSFVYNLKGYR